MKKIVIITGIIFICATSIKFYVKSNVSEIHKYYAALTENKTNPSNFTAYEKHLMMDTYLMKHKKRFLIKDIINDSDSITVKFWYGITVNYLFSTEEFD